MGSGATVSFAGFSVCRGVSIVSARAVDTDGSLFDFSDHFVNGGCWYNQVCRLLYSLKDTAIPFPAGQVGVVSNTFRWIASLIVESLDLQRKHRDRDSPHARRVLGSMPRT